jgi:hypothetical protein
MYYSDGSVYEGEWFNNMKNGQGMLRLGMLTVICVAVRITDLNIGFFF